MKIQIEFDGITEEEKQEILMEEFIKKMREMASDIEVKRIRFSFGEDERSEWYENSDYYY